MSEVIDRLQSPVDVRISELSGLLGMAGEKFEILGDDVFGGSVFDALGIDGSDPRPGADVLLSRSLGWVLQDGARFAPDVTRLKSAVEASGFGIELIEEANEDGEVPAELYAPPLLECKHVVGVNNLEHYLHDISSDHAPAPAVAGEEIFELLLPKKKLFRPHSLVDIAENYDASTEVISYDLDGFLRRALSPDRRVVAQKILRYAVISPASGLTNREIQSRTAEVERLLWAGLERLELI